MLKLNLLKAMPVAVEGGLQEIKESDILSDESFLSQEPEKEAPVVEETPKETVEAAEPAPMVPESPEPVEESVEEETKEFEFKPKSKFPFVPVLVVLLLVAIGAGYLLLSKRQPKSGATQVSTKAPAAKAAKKAEAKAPAQGAVKTQQPAATQSTATQPATATAVSVPAGAEAQRETGVRVVNLFGKVLSSVPKGAQIAFLSFDGNAFTLELYAGTRAKLDQFLTNAKNVLPGFQYKVLAKDRSYFQGRTRPHLLISGELGTAGAAEAGTATLTTGAIRSALRKLAAGHGIRVRELRTAALVVENGQKRVHVTLKVSGTQDSIQSFLSDLLKRYTNLSVSRLFVSAAKSGAAGKLDVAADLNVFPE